jgi:putative phosphoribosyl transferase
MPALFHDREDAGRALARELSKREDLEDPVVLALPRGGVPVGLEIARALEAPLDILVVRKLGLPEQPELAMGAVASGGIRVLNEDLLREGILSESVLDRVAKEELEEVERRERVYRGRRPAVDIRDRTVILVDDGIATGSTVRAAIQAARERGARKIVVATPVAPPETVRQLAREADDVVCLATPRLFMAISPWYRHFPQLEDQEVHRVLEAAPTPPAGSS